MNRIVLSLLCMGLLIALLGTFLPAIPIAASIGEGPVGYEISAKTDSVGSWTQVPGSTDSTLHSVSMLSTTDGYAVGGIPYMSGHPSQDSIIRHWDGTTWQINNSPIPNPLYAVSMFSATEGYAVGEFGRVLHWNGMSWSNVSVPAVNCLLGVTMVSATEVWAVGCNGKTLHRTESGGVTTWEIVSANTAESLRSVFAVSPTDVWAVGGNAVSGVSVIRRWNGSTWTTVASPVTSALTSVYMLSSTNGLIAGRDGTILQWGGSTWETATTPVTVTLNSIQLVSAADAWAVGGSGSFYLGGGDGTILHWDGDLWAEVTSPVTDTLFSIQMLSAAEGWAVGSSGTILHYGRPELLIRKTGPSGVEPGEAITYTLTITNSGTVPASGVVVTDTLPDGAHYVSGGMLLAGGIVSWTISSLPANDSMQVWLTVTATQTITNSDYGVSCAEGAAAAGTEPVITRVEYRVYLPLVLRRFP